MNGFTFVHAADLHLDAPFHGVRAALREETGNEARALAELMPKAGFVALKRLVDVCLQERAAFLILSGDVLNAAEGSLRAEAGLRDACLKLRDAGIAVFLAHGNHDPLRERRAVPLPKNVTIFGPEPEVHELRFGDRAVRVAGISHTRDKEDRNLAALFPALEPGAFRIGVLHCALSGRSGPHEAYAPCGLEDLLRVGCDYWALGHVHTRQEIRPFGPTGPCIAYPGSLQPLHVRETGEHGCLVVRVTDSAHTTEFVPLAPIRWEAPEVDLEETGNTLPELEAFLLDRVCALRPASESAFPPPMMPLRLILSGRTDLHRELAAPQAAAQLRERLNDALEGSGVWLRDVFVAPRPPRDMEALAQRPDLVGAVARRADAALEDGEAEAAAREALDELFASPRYTAHIPAPDAAELRELIRRAKDLCLDLLEADRCD